MRASVGLVVAGGKRGPEGLGYQGEREPKGWGAGGLYIPFF